MNTKIVFSVFLVVVSVLSNALYQLLLGDVGSVSALHWLSLILAAFFVAFSINFSKFREASLKQGLILGSISAVLVIIFHSAISSVLAVRFPVGESTGVLGLLLLFILRLMSEISGMGIVYLPLMLLLTPVLLNLRKGNI